ncbi:rhomboid family intramembrane serine protease [Nodosilinea sp. LEGE 07298]|uniref:rhomboid family intramembrane serine protease n=1 Tax=Nodosilinea sp. LEGE 07298 TaxID=2777970 RepID=UPI001D149B22|nr:rhomboid family intramembrane serine protease [Nodosilinea sp. LEGE 07298]
MFSFDPIILPEGFREGVLLLAYLLVLMWALAIVDFVTGRRMLNQLSIRPRSIEGIPGIAIAPLLHGGFGHLAANSGPLAILGTIILLQGLEVLGLVTVFCWLFSGAGIWLLGRPGTRHLGASGVVFGYLGYILLRGYFERSPAAIAAAVIVGLLYGSALWGLLPLQRGKSWIGHGAGFVAGAIVARKLPIMLEWVRYNSGF